MQDVLRLHSGENEWTFMESKHIPGLILNDRLMTDAALGTRPIKTEHSYSLASDGDSNPDSPNSRHVDEMEEECYPAIKMNTACDRLTEEEEDEDEENCVEIKEEEMERYSETDSIQSSCPPSPQPQQIQIGQNGEIHLDVNMTTIPQLLTSGTLSNFLITTPHTTITSLPQRILPKYSIKVADSMSNFNLPPTPPSCTSSDDSEDNATISQPSSPAARKNTTKVIMGTRNPIHTPLISQQPKGSTGNLILTEEEKRTLIAEGYPIPQRLPLTKAEEKSLKKIRRKIKNKISAQESRRKKKEYMDQLEKKVDILVNENQNYKKKINSLEDSNNSLMIQLQKLQALVAKANPQLLKQLQNGSNDSQISFKCLPKV